MNVLEAICKEDLRANRNHPAIITSRGTLSYQQLNTQVNTVSAYLHTLGIRQNSKAVILGGNSAEYLVYLLALWNLNACAIPLNTMLLEDELMDLIDFSDAEFLFYDEEYYRDLKAKLTLKPLTLSLEVNKPYNEPLTDTNAVSLILFTSGATGKPKGVMHSLSNLNNSADNSQRFLKQTEDDKWLASLPFYHIGGLSIIIRALRFGSPLVIPESPGTEDLRKALDNLSPAFVSFVSTQLSRLLDSGWKPGENLKTVLLGGGFTDKELVNEAVAAGCRIANVYGSTETSAFVAALTPESAASKPASSGKALGRSKLYIVDDELKHLPRGASGEILVEANSLFRGYYKDDETTSNKLKDGHFYTGDIGYIDDEGDLFVEARRTDLIVTGGENVNPLEVENTLNKIPGIKDSCVFALQDREWGQLVAAAVVTDRDISSDEITRMMKDKISGYKIPKKYFPFEKIPRTSLGKIMREKVKEEIEALINLRD